MSALVETQRAAGGDAVATGISEIELEDNIFPDAPLSPATDYDDENEDPMLLSKLSLVCL